jgi:hypothetical protein
MSKNRLRGFGTSLAGYISALCRSKRRINAALCLVAVITAIMILSIQVHSSRSHRDLPARINHPLPPLVVQHSQGKVDLNSIISGSRCIIVFYAPSCKACKEILPALRPLPGKLRLIPVSVTPEQEPSLLQSSRDEDRFYDQWGVLSRSFAAASLPVILFVDEKGILRHGIFGSRDPGTLRQKLKDFAAHSEPAFCAGPIGLGQNAG